LIQTYIVIEEVFFFQINNKEENKKKREKNENRENMITARKPFKKVLTSNLEKTTKNLYKPATPSDHYYLYGCF
jgi:hypothetical protein